MAPNDGDSTRTPGVFGQVLLVDENPEQRDVYRKILKDGGFVVEIADTGSDPEQLLRASDPDAVVADEETMASKFGRELMLAVETFYAEVPVILLLAGPPPEAKGLEAMNVLRWLLKPVPAPLLQTSVREAVRKARLSRIRRRTEVRRRLRERILKGDIEQRARPRPSSKPSGIEERFQAALDALHLVFQPIVRWSAKQVFAFEALMRSGEPSMAHPGKILDAAERLGVPWELGRTVRRLVAAKIPEAPAERIFVNLHSRDLLDEELFSSEAPLTRWAKRVVLEITERASLDAIKDIHERIAKLRELGYAIAVDDLGSGYAGLNAFAELQPDVAKIDMTLVRDVDQQPIKAKLIRSLTSVCHDMNIAVIAEGVETEAELQRLVELDCDLLQGYFFAKPAFPYPEVRWA